MYIHVELKRGRFAASLVKRGENDFIRQFNNNFVYAQLTKMNNLCVIPLFAVGTLCLGISLEMLSRVLLFSKANIRFLIEKSRV